MTYYFAEIRNENERDKRCFEFRDGIETLEILSYDIDKISVADAKQKKREFFNFICSKYNDVNRRDLLMLFAYMDDDMLEYYKEQYPIKELQKSGNWLIKDCPKRTERYYKKLTVDEKMFIEHSLQQFRNRFGYKVAN